MSLDYEQDKVDNKISIQDVIGSKIDEIYSMLGTKDYNDVKYKVTSIILNDALSSVSHDIHYKVRVLGADDKEYLVHPSTSVNIRLRLMYERLNDPVTDWKDLLVHTDFRVVLNEYEGQIVLYENIPLDVGRFLMVNGYGPFLFKVIQNDKLLHFNGRSVELLEKYLQKEKSFTTKSTILGNIAEKDEDREYMAFSYLRDLICDVPVGKLQSFCKQNDLQKIAQKLKISSLDLAYRVYKGMNIQEAKKIGVFERDHYSLFNAKYSNVEYCNTVSFIIGYIRNKIKNNETDKYRQQKDKIN